MEIRILQVRSTAAFQLYSTEEIAVAVRDHALATNVRIDTVQLMVDQKVLVPGQWDDGTIQLFYNSPNGL